MPAYFDKFDQAKIDLLRNHLILMAGKDTPKFYEIFVDTLKAVQKTDDPKEFDDYETYLSPSTNFIKIIVYSGLSPRNDQYFFSFKAETQEEALEIGLNGIAVKTYSLSELADLKTIKTRKTLEAQEIQNLKHELAGLHKDLKEKQEYIAQCERGLQIARENGNKIGGFHAGDILSRALEGYIKRNSQKIEAFTGINGLAGIINREETPGQASLPSAPDTEASFKRKEVKTEQPVLTPQETEFLALFKILRSHFKESDMNQIMEILEALSKDKTQIQPVLDLLQE